MPRIGRRARDIADFDSFDDIAFGIDFGHAIGPERGDIEEVSRGVEQHSRRLGQRLGPCFQVGHDAVIDIRVQIEGCGRSAGDVDMRDTIEVRVAP